MVQTTQQAGVVPHLGRLEAERLGHRYLGPEHLLAGLLRDAQGPLETALDTHDRRLRGLLGLPDRGPHPIRLLVEGRGLTLEVLVAAVLHELDQVQWPRRLDTQRNHSDGGPRHPPHGRHRVGRCARLR